MGIKKTTTLKTLFRYFVIQLSILLFFAVSVPLILFIIASNVGYVTNANQNEIQVKELKEIMMIAPDITKVIIPPNFKYLVIDKNFEELYSNMKSFEEKQAAIAFSKGEQLSYSSKQQYLLVLRENEYCIIQYYIGSEYTIPWLEEHLPSPEILIVLLMIINCLLVFILATANLSKRLKNQLEPLLLATNEIAAQNLDFEVEHCNIKEFEDILCSFDNMRNSLKSSLEKQWQIEQSQKDQIAAIAHDLKTPLTIIQGNLDLLSETKLNTEQNFYLKYALDSSEQMKQYIQILIDISRAATGYQFKPQSENLPKFWNYILNQTEIICRNKKIVLKHKESNLPQYYTMDRMLLERAIMNVVSNAVDYTPNNSLLYMETRVINSFLEIIIIDSGKGFSKEALKHANERFYMGDSSRCSKQHFGMGLYITDSIVKQHDGEMILENSEITSGASIIIKLPI